MRIEMPSQKTGDDKDSRPKGPADKILAIEELRSRPRPIDREREERVEAGQRWHAFKE